MLLDLINLSKLRRAIIYALFLAGVFVLQDLFVARVTIFGVKAVLIPAAVAAIGLFEGGVWGGLMGLAAGYFMDMGYTETTVFFAVFLTTTGFFAGVLGKYMLHKGFVSYMFLVTVIMIFLALFQIIRILFFLGTVSPWIAWRTGLIQTLWSLPWVVPLFFPCRSIAGHTLTS